MERCYIAKALLNLLKKGKARFFLDGNLVEIKVEKGIINLYLNKELVYSYDLSEEKVLAYKKIPREVGVKIVSERI